MNTSLQADAEKLGVRICPFCGGYPIVEVVKNKAAEIEWITYRVRCDSGCCATVGGRETQDEAISAWNKREGSIENLYDEIVAYQSDLAMMEADRDHYKARVKALERAAKQHAICETCIHECHPLEGCFDGDNWKFDHERFVDKEDENE